MPDALGIDTTPDEMSVDFLGKTVPLAFRNQPALPVTGGPAVGAPTGPVTPGNQPAPVLSQAGGTQVGTVDPSLVSLALSGGVKLADLAGKLFPNAGIAAGAIDTPSGQLTVSAPEILRPQQFPDVPDVPGGTFASEGTATPVGQAGSSLGADIGAIAGPALGGATSALDIVNAIRTGNPSGVIGPAANIGLIAGEAAGFIPSQAIGPLGSAAGVIAAIISDAITSPSGKLAVEQFNQQMAQQVPAELQGLQLAGAALPLIGPNLTTEQALGLYQIARQGIVDEQLLADPLSRQGKSKAGVAYGTYPGAEAEATSLAPSAILATIRLQDLLASRGVTPDQVPNLPSSVGNDPSQVTPGWLDPPALLGILGGAGGFTQPNLAEIQNAPQEIAAYGISSSNPAPLPTPDQYYLYGPALMSQLEAIKPGGYEAGLRSILEGQPGYAGSPLAGLWGSEGPSAPAGAPVADTEAPLTADTVSTAFGESTLGGGADLEQELLGVGA